MSLKKHLLSSTGLVLAGVAGACAAMFLAPDLFKHLGAGVMVGMTILTESFHRGGFVVSEADGYLSREKVTIVSGQDLDAGDVLGQISGATAGLGSPNAGNTGAGVFGAITLSAGAKIGTYKVDFVQAATNAGEFIVTDPAGLYVGEGKVGVAFSAGGVGFTIADGSPDFVVGDGFTFTNTVNASAGKYKEYNPTNTDGSQTAVAILYDDCDATAGDTQATVMARNCEVNASELVWFSGASSPQIATATAQLALKTIIARASAG